MLNFIKKMLGKGGPSPYEMLNEGAVLIDVRSAGEYKSGHAPGSKNIPLQSIGKHVEKLRKKGKPVVTCCASGMRSGAAARQLRAAGIEAVNGGPWHKFS